MLVEITDLLDKVEEIEKEGFTKREAIEILKLNQMIRFNDGYPFEVLGHELCLAGKELLNYK